MEIRTTVNASESSIMVTMDTEDTPASVSQPSEALTGYLPCGGTLNITYLLQIIFAVFILVANFLVLVVMPFTDMKKQFKIFVSYLAVADMLAGVMLIMSVLIYAYRCSLPLLFCTSYYIVLGCVYCNSFFAICTMSMYSLVLVKDYHKFDVVLSPRRCYMILLAGSSCFILLCITGCALQDTSRINVQMRCIWGSGAMPVWLETVLSVINAALILLTIVLQIISLLLLKKKRDIMIVPFAGQQAPRTVSGAHDSRVAVSVAISQEPYSMTRALEMQRTSSSVQDGKSQISRWATSSVALPSAGTAGAAGAAAAGCGGDSGVGRSGTSGTLQLPVAGAGGQERVVRFTAPSPALEMPGGVCQYQYNVLSKYAWTTSLVVLALIVLWLPYLLLVYAMAICRVSADCQHFDALVSALQVLTVLPILNSVVNIFIYAGKDLDFRRTMCSLLCRCQRPEQHW